MMFISVKGMVGLTLCITCFSLYLPVLKPENSSSNCHLFLAFISWLKKERNCHPFKIINISDLLSKADIVVLFFIFLFVFFFWYKMTFTLFLKSMHWSHRRKQCLVTQPPGFSSLSLLVQRNSVVEPLRNHYLKEGLDCLSYHLKSLLVVSV